MKFWAALLIISSLIKLFKVSTYKDMNDILLSHIPENTPINKNILIKMLAFVLCFDLSLGLICGSYILFIL